MNTLAAPTPRTATWQPAGPEALLLPVAALHPQPVRRLALAAGQTLLLDVLAGQVWLTCEGQPEDHFLRPGAPWTVCGPATLHLSAEGAGPARLRLQWGRDPGSQAGAPRR